MDAELISLCEQLDEARTAYQSAVLANRAGRPAQERVAMDIAEGKAMDRLMRVRCAYDEALKPIIQAAE